MTCQRFEADLVDLARGALGNDDAASARRHLEACEACAARFEGERRLTEGLRTLSAATTVPANDVAERRLMMAFASAQGALRQPERHSMVVRWAVWAAAASIFFFVGAWAAVEWRTRTASPQVTMASVQASLPAPAEQARPVEQVESPVPALDPLAADARRTRAPRVVRAASQSELPQETDRLAGFIPLPAAGGLPGFDSGMIVRVSIPTASLPAYGLAITPESSRTVNADLLVGQDGQARAIKLVSLVGGSRREPQ
jgi:anti-sigma factor RsiW